VGMSLHEINDITARLPHVSWGVHRQCTAVVPTLSLRLGAGTGFLALQLLVSRLPG
jgi:hypothetical protein